MSEKKAQKYMFYALGEIFLVVIGILIALSINNWNQNRLGRIEEEKLLKSIKSDFEKATSYFELLNTRRGETLFTFNELINIRNSGEFSNEVHIDTLLGKTVFTPTYNGKTSSIAILINSGKINLLKNDSLKYELLSWPQRVEDMTEGEQDAKRLTNEEWIPFIQAYTSVNDWFKYYSFEGVPAKKRNTAVQKDYKGLFGDRKFENTISKMELLYIAGKRETERLIGRSKNLIRMIENDLKNR